MTVHSVNVRSITLRGGVIATLVSWSGTALAQGCAMCKTALGGAGGPLAAGLNTSILFLMSMPFILVASVGVWLVYMFRRGQHRSTNVYVLPTQAKEGQS